MVVGTGGGGRFGGHGSTAGRDRRRSARFLRAPVGRGRELHGRLHGRGPVRQGVLRRTLEQDLGRRDHRQKDRASRYCMKRSQVRASRLVMRRIMAAYTNASPLAHSLERISKWMGHQEGKG